MPVFISCVVCFVFLVLLVYGLCYKLNKSIQLTFISFFFALSFIVSPIFMLNQEYKYNYSGWAAVGDFNFTFESMISVLSSGMVVYIFIILLSMISGKLHDDNFVKAKKAKEKKVGLKEKIDIKNDLIFIVVSISLIIFYFIMFVLRLGVSGVETPTEFHISGIVHYFRSYIAPFVFIYLFSKSKQNKSEYILALIYCLVAGLTASSRFCSAFPLGMLAVLFLMKKKYVEVLISLATFVLSWMLVSASRAYTFTEDVFSSLELVTKAFLYLSNINIFGHLGSITNRLGGAHEQVIAGILIDSNNCNNYVGFAKGYQLCNDVAGDGHGMDLSESPFGIGIATISKFVVFSEYNILLLVISALCIFMLMMLLRWVLNLMRRNTKSEALYYMLNLMGVFLIYIGPLIFYYIFLFFVLTTLVFIRLSKKKYYYEPYVGS